MTKYLKSGKTWQFPCLHKARKQCWFASHLIKRDIKSPWSTPEGAQESIAIDKDKFQENNSIKSGINMVVISICEEWNSTLKETLPGIIDNISLPLRWWNHAHNVFFSFLIFGKYMQNITIENITNIILYKCSHYDNLWCNQRWQIRHCDNSRFSVNESIHIPMGQHKKDVTPLLTHWSYVFLALTHWYWIVYI